MSQRDARLRVLRRRARRRRPSRTPATFKGIVRADGRVATRNYVAILSSVNCSATVSRAIADRFRRDLFPDALAPYPNVDGVIALTHGTGCGMDMGESMRVLRRTMAGYARHPNVAASIFVGLGCEANQITSLFGAESLQDGERVASYNMQDVGGTAKAIERGVALVREMLPAANRVERTPVPASHLMLGLQCGGSDGYSGITANPALGNAVDRLVAHGGTAILSETPEIYGAEHLLTRRAVSREVGEKLIARIKWWEDYTARNHGEMNNNPSPGNKAGGLTTILEKSLGAVAKGGTTNLVDVYEYAQPVDKHGFVYMDTPGYDPVSATGQVAGGANMIVFTTGRGSAYGCAPSPSLKLSTNTRTVAAAGRGHRPQLRRDRRRRGDDRGARRAAVRPGPADRVGQQDQERALRLRPERIRALATRGGDVSPCAVANPGGGAVTRGSINRRQDDAEAS